MGTLRAPRQFLETPKRRRLAKKASDESAPLSRDLAEKASDEPGAYEGPHWNVGGRASSAGRGHPKTGAAAAVTLLDVVGEHAPPESIDDMFAHCDKLTEERGEVASQIDP